MIQKRDYQIQRTDRILSLIDEHRTICSQLPTGGGKTVEFADIAMRYTRGNNKVVAIVVHRQELLNQAYKTLTQNYHVNPALVTSDTKHFTYARIYIGMVESFLNRLHLMDELDMIIVDECHQGEFKKVHDQFPDITILGYTATPIATSKKDPLCNYYETIVVGPQISELIAGGYLAQNITRCPKEIVDITRLEIDQRKGDFNDRIMSGEYSKPHHVLNVIRNYRKIALGKKTIVFNVTIEHSKTVTECFEMAGYNARHLDSNCTDEEREATLKWFKDTPDAILCNVMIATVGFDEPTIECVILNFSTLSLVKFIQCCGRGGRKLPGKDYFDIIDMGGNAIRHGDWCDDRDWEDFFYHPPKPGEGVAPVKTCPDCHALVHASKMKCGAPLANKVDFCEYEWEKKKRPQEQIMDELIILTKNIDVKKLISKNKNKYDYYTFLDIGDKVVQELYTFNPTPSETLKARAFDAYYGKCIEWYRNTLAGRDGYPLDITDDSWHIRRARINFDDLLEKHKK